MTDEQYLELKAEAKAKGYTIGRHRKGATWLYNLRSSRFRSGAVFYAITLTEEEAEQIIRLVPVQEAVQHVRDHDAAEKQRKAQCMPLQKKIWDLERQIAELHAENVRQFGKYEWFEPRAMLAEYVQTEGRQDLEAVSA